MGESPAEQTPDIRRVDVAAARPLRRRVLRAGILDADARFDGDDAPDTLHAGAFVDGRLVAVATVIRRSPPGEGLETAWQVRGMATEPGDRGRGLGGRLLDTLVEHARASGGSLVWCNARVRAIPLYERHGFEREGDVFVVEGLGPHVRMRLAL
jgi:ribosomal protein S18 acetylase RimI-like enzyme